jgi:hypothetical protein
LYGFLIVERDSRAARVGVNVQGYVYTVFRKRGMSTFDQSISIIDFKVKLGRRRLPPHFLDSRA